MIKRKEINLVPEKREKTSEKCYILGYFLIS